MNIKRLLRFYFGAEEINRAIDGIIMRKACLSYRRCGEGERAAEEVCALIGDKTALERLYSYLSGAISGLDGGTIETLGRYCLLRRGDGERATPAMKRALFKMWRRARRLNDFSKEIAVADRYICFAAPPLTPP